MLSSMMATRAPITTASDTPCLGPMFPCTVAGFDEVVDGAVAVLFGRGIEVHESTGACPLIPLPGLLGSTGGCAFGTSGAGVTTGPGPPPGNDGPPGTTDGETGPAPTVPGGAVPGGGKVNAGWVPTVGTPPSGVVLGSIVPGCTPPGGGVTGGTEKPGPTVEGTELCVMVVMKTDCVAGIVMGMTVAGGGG